IIYTKVTQSAKGSYYYFPFDDICNEQELISGCVTGKISIPKPHFDWPQYFGYTSIRHFIFWRPDNS
ncbi:MAG: hypothetical protein V3T59_00250, partial [Desulfobacterales bacterium]